MGLPVTIVTGFLGSGKSTLLNQMLRAPQMKGAAVIINEFGAVPIDQVLVKSAIENTTVLDNGCICCTIRGDLIDTVMDLEAGVERGELPAFDRVVIETTGLADAAPILNTLTSDPAISGRYEVWSVITTLDVTHAVGQLAAHEEARRQVALATLLVLTKTDIADEAETAATMAAARILNPGAPMEIVVNGAIIGDMLFAAGAKPNSETLRNWLAADAHDHQHDDHHRHEHHHGDPNRHGSDILSHVVTADVPVLAERLRRLLVSVSSLRGAQLLRVKGVANVQGIDQPVVVQGVQHALYAPVRLEAWPDADRRTRLVFITQGLGRGALAVGEAFLKGELT